MPYTKHAMWEMKKSCNIWVGVSCHQLISHFGSLAQLMVNACRKPYYIATGIGSRLCVLHRFTSFSKLAISKPMVHDVSLGLPSDFWVFSPALDSQPAKGNLPIGSELRRLASLFLNLPVNGWLRGSNLWFFWVLGLPWGLGALGPSGLGALGLIFGDFSRPPWGQLRDEIFDQNMASVAWTNLKVTLATAKFFQESVAHPHGNPWKSHTPWPRVCFHISCLRR